MIKKLIISISAIALTLALSTASYSQVSPKPAKVNTAKPSEAATLKPQADLRNPTAKEIISKDSRQIGTDSNSIRKRAEMEAKRNVRDYNLTDEQMAKAVEIFFEAEKQMNEYRQKINEINKDKMAKFNALLTPEQIKAKQDADAKRREEIKANREEQLKVNEKNMPEQGSKVIEPNSPKSITPKK